jgi:type II secretory pathway component PulF
VVLRDVRERLASGESLGRALERHPRWFDGVFRGAVEVGQTSGQLDQALDDLAAYMRERQALRGKFFNALAYPVILAVLGVGVVLFLMTYVVPQLLGILETSGKSLPFATRVLKGMSDFVVGHWLALLITATTAAMVAAAVGRSDRGRFAIQRAMLAVPALGSLVAKNEVAQFARMMSLLLRSGVTFLDALRIFRSECGNLVLATELQATETAVQRGSDIAPTLESSRVFPPLVVHVVNVGQQTGELTTMLTHLSDGYAAEVRLAVTKFTAVLEPLLMVVMSIVIGFVVFATMMPILEVTRTLQ